MEPQVEQSVSRKLFGLGARLGSLEGYLYNDRQADETYLPGWIANIEREFNSLPGEMRNEIRQDYLAVWKKVEVSVQKVCGANGAQTARVGKIIAVLTEEKI